MTKEQQAEKYALNKCKSCSDPGTYLPCICSNLESAFIAGWDAKPEGMEIVNVLKIISKKVQDKGFGTSANKQADLYLFCQDLIKQFSDESSQSSPAAEEGMKEVLKSIYDMCVINIPFHAYGDHEAACQLADQLNHVREFLAHDPTAALSFINQEDHRDTPNNINY